MTTQSISFVVLSAGLEEFNQIRSALASDARAKLLSGGNDADQVCEEVVRLKPSAAIISLGVNSEQAIKLIERLKEECPGTALISAAKESSAELILHSLRMGAREFLRLPINIDELKTVMDRVSEFSAKKSDKIKRIGRMVAVFSSKGGCGTSFIASNLAVCTNVPTILVDMNFEAGDLPLFLGVDAKHSIASMISHRAVLDKELIKAYVTPHSPELDLLAAPKEVDPVEKIQPEHIFEILQKLRENYGYVVLDLQHTYDAITLAALDQADKIVLVLSLDIPAIRSTKRALQIFEQVGYPRKKVVIVVNRWSKRVDLDLRRVEEFLAAPVSGTLTSDYQTVVHSINLGNLLVKSDPRSRIAKEIRHVARVLDSERAESEELTPKRAWNFFLKRQLPE